MTQHDPARLQVHALTLNATGGCPPILNIHGLHTTNNVSSLRTGLTREELNSGPPTATATHSMRPSNTAWPSQLAHGQLHQANTKNIYETFAQLVKQRLLLAKERGSQRLSKASSEVCAIDPGRYLGPGLASSRPKSSAALSVAEPKTPLVVQGWL